MCCARGRRTRQTVVPATAVKLVEIRSVCRHLVRSSAISRRFVAGVLSGGVLGATRFYSSGEGSGRRAQAAKEARS